MIWKNILYNDYKPQKKCGADPASALLIGSGISAGTSLLGGIGDSTLGYNQQSHMLNRQMDFQREENQINRDWNTREAEKARQHQSYLQGQQFVQTGLLQNQQQEYNLQSMAQQAEYNSPVYQRQQLQAAGINPNVYFGQQSSFSGSSGIAGGSPSAPSAPASPQASGNFGLNPIGFQPSHLNIANIASSVGGMIRDLAEAKKLGVETGMLPDEISAKIRSMNAQTDLNAALKIGQQISNELQNAKLPYAFRMAQTELEQALKNLELTEQNTLTSKSQEQVNKALDRMNYELANLHGKEAEKLGLDIKTYMVNLKSIINLRSAQSAESNASAALMNWKTEFSKLSSGIEIQRMTQSLSNLEKEGSILSWQVDAARSAAQIAGVNASHAEELFWKDFILDIVSEGFDAFLGYRNSKSFRNLSNASQADVARKIEDMRYKYGDEFEEIYHPNGKVTQKYRTRQSK